MREFSGSNGTVQKGYRYLCADCTHVSEWFVAQDGRYADGLARHAGWSKPRSLDGWLCATCVKAYRRRHSFPTNRKGRTLTTPTTRKQLQVRTHDNDALASFWKQQLAHIEPRGNDMGEMRK